LHNLTTIQVHLIQGLELGELQPYSFGRTTAMGGASLASRNNQQINLANPASYTAVDSLGFMFEFGLNANFQDLATILPA
jgi:hypothetical protein